MTIQHLIRSDLQNFKPYSSARDENAERDKIFLNANESPWEYLLTFDNIILNRYPDKQPRELLSRLADLYQVQDNELVMLRGSDEAIDLLIRLFCSAREDAIMICPPTFGMYAVSAAIQGVEVIEVPVHKAEDFQVNYTELLLKWSPKVKLIFLCSPNNPTGNLLDPQEIIELCRNLEGKSIVVVDEAYIEFSEQGSMANYLNTCTNLVVLRTFSKAYGLAGARCGFLLAQQEIVEWIKYIAAPYPLSCMVIAVMTQALTTARLAEVQQQISLVRTERNHMFKALTQIACVQKVWPSVANYLLIEVENSQTVMHYCAEQGFILRDMSSKPGLENCIRVSIGKPEENLKFLQTLQKIIAK